MSVITLDDALYISRMRWEDARNDLEQRGLFGAQSQEVMGPQWAVSMAFDKIPENLSGPRKAMIMKLRGMANQLEVYDVARPAPLGTLRGSGVPFSLAANVAQGATSMQLTAGTSNLCTKPESFDNAVWLKTGLQPFGSGSVIDAIAAPDGSLSMDKIVEDATSSNHYLGLASALTIGVAYAASIFAKAGERSLAYIWGSNTSANGGGLAVFDLSTGAVYSNNITNGSPAIVDVGGGIYRCSVLFPSTITANQSLRYGMYNGNTTYTGDGVSGLYIWGAKLETGSAVTDYGYGKTLLKGDLLGIGSGLTQQVVMLTEDATSTGQGNITVNFEHPLRNAFTAGTQVRWDKPKALFRRQNSRAGWDYETVFASGFELDLLEDWRP